MVSELHGEFFGEMVGLPQSWRSLPQHNHLANIAVWS